MALQYKANQTQGPGGGLVPSSRARANAGRLQAMKMRRLLDFDVGAQRQCFWCTLPTWSTRMRPADKVRTTAKEATFCFCYQGLILTRSSIRLDAPGSSAAASSMARADTIGTGSDSTLASERLQMRHSSPSSLVNDSLRVYPREAKYEGLPKSVGAPRTEFST